MKHYLWIVFMTGLLTGCARQSSAVIDESCRPYDTWAPLESMPTAVPDANAFTAGVSEPNGILTLGQALALTLMHNPALNVFSLEVRAAGARQLQAGLWPNPEIEVEVEEIGGTGERSGFDSAETTIQLSQLIELGNKSQKREKIAAFEKELAGLDYQTKRLEVFSEAAKAFIEVLKAQEQLRLSDELFKLAEESFGAVDQRVRAGKDAPVEKARAWVALADVRIALRRAQQDLDAARKQLAYFWGQENPLFVHAAGSLEGAEAIPEFKDLAVFLKQNPEYMQRETAIRRSQAVLALERSKTYGDITVGAGLRRYNETDDNAFVFGVSIPLPLSDQNQGAKQEAAYNLSKTRQEQKAAWLQLQAAFNRTYQELSNAYIQAAALKSEVLPAATEMFESAQTAYREGKVDYLNMLDAQRTLFEARGRYLDALSAYHQARTDVERFIGQPIKTTNILQQP